MKTKMKNIATSLTATVFAVVGITGVLMYFHILDNYTKALHENLGVVFFVIVFAHIFVNWKQMKAYFTKKVFGFATVLALVVSIAFISSSKAGGENPKIVLIQSVLKAPIDVSSKVLNLNMDDALAKLEKAGIKLGENSSIEQIAKSNKTSPFRVVSIITAK